MDRIESGIKGLDYLLGGGLPRGKCILLVGGPGSGKTIFGIQFLISGAKADEPGMYISLDEKPDEIKAEMASFKWDLEDFERHGKLFFIDATSLRRIIINKGIDYSIKRRQFDFGPITLENVLETTIDLVREEGIKRIVVDPITALTMCYDDPTEKRAALLNFFDSLSATDCVSIITSELRAPQLNGEFQVEEFLAQGVIVLDTIMHEGTLIKAILIEKMRGIEHDVQYRPYRITKNGIEIFHKDRIF